MCTNSHSCTWSADYPTALTVVFLLLSLRNTHRLFIGTIQYASATAVCTCSLAGKTLNQIISTWIPNHTAVVPLYPSFLNSLATTGFPSCPLFLRHRYVVVVSESIAVTNTDTARWVGITNPLRNTTTATPIQSATNAMYFFNCMPPFISLSLSAPLFEELECWNSAIHDKPHHDETNQDYKVPFERLIYLHPIHLLSVFIGVLYRSVFLQYGHPQSPSSSSSVWMYF